MWGAAPPHMPSFHSAVDVAQSGVKRRFPWGAEANENASNFDASSVYYGYGQHSGGGVGTFSADVVVRGAFGSGRGRGAVPLPTLWDGGSARTAPLARASASAQAPEGGGACCSCNKNIVAEDGDGDGGGGGGGGGGGAPCAHCERAACDSCLAACDLCAAIFCLNCGVKK